MTMDFGKTAKMCALLLVFGKKKRTRKLWVQLLTFSRLMTYIYIYIYIYMSYRTSNRQMLHFIYLLNKYTY